MFKLDVAVTPKFRLLVLNSYGFLPVKDGGHERCFNLYCQLSKKIDVTIVSLNLENKYSNIENRADMDNFMYIDIPLESSQISLAHKIGNQLKSGSWDLAKMLAYEEKSNTTRYIHKLIQSHDLVVLAHPWMYPYVHGAQTPILYDAHNNEFEAFKNYYGSDSIDAEIAKFAEDKVLNKADYLTACSENDLLSLVSRTERTVLKKVIQNGSKERQKIANNNSQSRDLVFIGSGHYPNVQAAEVICEMALKLKQYNFYLIGTVGLALNRKVPKNVFIKGYISDNQLDGILNSSLALLNPMMMGSGTHLKIPRALSMGLPIISTEIGARGVNQPKKNGFLICEEFSEFEKALLFLTNDENWQKKSNEAKKLFDEFNWLHISHDFENFITNNCLNPLFEKKFTEQFEHSYQKGNKRIGVLRYIWQLLPIRFRRRFWDKIYPKYLRYKNRNLDIDNHFSNFKTTFS